ncbi:MAG: hypothetical protein M3R02_17020 [Chloroflexota bacterium]|nr:hypothetical protein [Chloroflexota bacterium]
MRLLGAFTLVLVLLASGVLATETDPLAGAQESDFASTEAVYQTIVAEQATQIAALETQVAVLPDRQPASSSVVPATMTPTPVNAAPEVTNAFTAWIQDSRWSFAAEASAELLTLADKIVCHDPVVLDYADALQYVTNPTMDAVDWQMDLRGCLERHDRARRAVIRRIIPR